MASTSGTAASCAAVVQALATFASSMGWTINNNAAYSGGWWLSISEGSVYRNYQTPSTDGEIWAFGATGFSSTAAPNAQPGGMATPAICNPKAGPFTAYYFYSSSSASYLHCVIEISPGIFSHFHAGALAPAGGAGPGIYATATNWSWYNANSGRADSTYNIKPFDANSGGGGNGPVTTQGSAYGATLLTIDGYTGWYPFTSSGTSPHRLTQSGYVEGFGSAWQSTQIQATPNTFDGIPVLSPIPIFAERGVGNVYSMVGEVLDCRIVNMMNNNPGDTLTIGSDTWVLYPLCQNFPNWQINSLTPSSWPFGLAFRSNA